MNKKDGLERRARKTKIRKIILKTVAVAGVMSVALIAPSVLISMKKLGFIPHRRQKETIVKSRNKLVKDGLLFFEGNKLRITEKGRDFLIREEIIEKAKRENRRWDGKWRVLVFDIPEKKRVIRGRIRNALTSLGFMRLQNSVWIYPYNCEDYINLIKAELKIGKDVLYMIVEELEYDKPVRKYFGFKEE
jgi:CRISPR-associated endonuclease Cas2